MKLLIILLISFLLTAIHPVRAHAQAQELEELALDIEKLAQLKNILNDMYKGYQILTKGYETIKGLAEGNFHLHDAFLQALLTVSPLVRHCPALADIVQTTQRLSTETRNALAHWSAAQVFSADELKYIEQVYTGLLSRSGDCLDGVAMVVTDGQLRMNDAERLTLIDQFYADITQEAQFLATFNRNTALLAAHRERSRQENQVLQKLIGPQ